VSNEYRVNPAGTSLKEKNKLGFLCVRVSVLCVLCRVGRRERRFLFDLVRRSVKFKLKGRKGREREGNCISI